jgi:radical SAM superfamily enzyme YgiQ (UPF0313 family)
MKVLFINPPRSPFNALLSHASSSSQKYIHKKLIGPPLGLLTIARAIENDCDLRLLETKAFYDAYEQKGATEPPSLEQLVKTELEYFQPDIVGVTFIASEYDFGMEIFAVAKAFNPTILTVAGGLHTTLCPDHFFHKDVDVISPGESVKKIRGIVAACRARRPLTEVGGIIVQGTDGSFSHTGPAEPVDSANADYLVPMRSLVSPWLSTYIVGNAPGPSTYMFTSLGCNHRCSFCSIWPQYGGAFSQRKTESIVAELKTIPEYPVVRFADANTLVHEQFLDTLFQRIEEEGIRKAYIMDMRVDAAVKNPKLIERLAKGGLKVVISGFESFRNEELLKYQKSQDAGLISQAVDIFRANGIMIRGNYVIPPDYTEDDFNALRDWSSANAVALAGYTILTPMPGTGLYTEMKDRIIDFDLRKYNFFNCVTKTALPLETFYSLTADLWSVREGEDVI